MDELMARLRARDDADCAAAAAEIGRLRARNREMNRRLTRNESGLHARAAIAEAELAMWRGIRTQSWDRMAAAFDEVRRIFGELRRAYGYPEAAHSFMDTPASGTAAADGAVYANLYADPRKGGIVTFRVLDEVRRAVDELLSLRGAADAALAGAEKGALPPGGRPAPPPTHQTKETGHA